MTIMQRRQQRLSKNSGERRSTSMSQTMGAVEGSGDSISYARTDRKSGAAAAAAAAMTSTTESLGLPGLEERRGTRASLPRYSKRSPKVSKTGGGSGVAGVRALNTPGGGGAGGEGEYTKGLVGLKNLGNTCFMNSGLQCVFNSPGMEKFFEGGWKGRGELVKCFSDVFNEVLSGTPNSSVTPMMFKRVLGKYAPHLAGFAQQDCQEFVMFLLNGLSEDMHGKGRIKEDVEKDEIIEKWALEKQGDYWWSRHLELNSSFINEVFFGQLQSTITCSYCSNKSYCFDPFSTLSLPIPKKGPEREGLTRRMGNSLRRSFGRKDSVSNNPTLSSNPNSVSIEDCLKLFTTPETIDSDNKPFCSKCKKKRKGTKQFGIFRMPQVLVVHLKRFNNNRSKITTEVSFKDSLDMSPYSSAVETGPVSEENTYELYGVCNHIGNYGGGHYTADCKKGGTWWNFNDSYVSKNTAGVGSDGGCEPYVLFYKRKGL